MSKIVKSTQSCSNGNLRYHCSFYYLARALIHDVAWICVRSKDAQKQLARTPILVPRGRAPFGQHQKSRPLARSNDIPVLNGFVNTIDWDQNQSHLSDLTLSMRRATGSPWIADFRCWTWPEVVIFGADQKERGLWGRECANALKSSILQQLSYCFVDIFSTREEWEQFVAFSQPCQPGTAETGSAHTGVAYTNKC